MNTSADMLYALHGVLAIGLIIWGCYLFKHTAPRRDGAERKRVTPLTIFFRAMWLAAAGRWWWGRGW
jgi:hypothetical protein